MLKNYLQIVCVLLMASPIMAADLVEVQQQQEVAFVKEFNSELKSFMKAAVQAWEKNEADNKARDEKIFVLGVESKELRERINGLTKENRQLRDAYVKQLSAGMLRDLSSEKNSLMAKIGLYGTGLAASAFMSVGALVLSEKFQNIADNKIFEPLMRISDINSEIMALEISPKCAILDSLRKQFMWRYKKLRDAQSEIGSFRRQHTTEDEGRVTYHISHEIIASVEEDEYKNFEREKADFETYKNNFDSLVAQEYEKLGS